MSLGGRASESPVQQILHTTLDPCRGIKVFLPWMGSRHAIRALQPAWSGLGLAEFEFKIRHRDHMLVRESLLAVSHLS
jgi:hypothetical protein